MKFKKGSREKLKATAKRIVKRRMKNSLIVKPLLVSWIKEREKRKKKEEICPICGESMPETFQKHHIDGNHHNNSKKNQVYICASCHNITYKADTHLKELWLKRHKAFLNRQRRSKNAWITMKKRKR